MVPHRETGALQHIQHRMDPEKG